MGRSNKSTWAYQAVKEHGKIKSILRVLVDMFVSVARTAWWAIDDGIELIGYIIRQ